MHTMHGMTRLFTPIDPNQPSDLLSRFNRRSTQAPAAGALPDFRQMLSLMVISMTMPTTSDSGSGSGLSGMGNMMGPLLLMLMEQMLGQQGQSGTLGGGQAAGSSLSAASAPSPAAAAGASTGKTGGDKDRAIPQGLPVKGPMSQAAHPGHMAVDIAIPVGTKVSATHAGKVVYAGWNDEGYGNLVIVQNGPYRTYYAHLSKVDVQVGQKVVAGQVLALSGNTGNSTGPHIHYEVRVNGQQMNPMNYARARQA
jgi:murein DD-endopeptidase MepM/ murein hydrolase activator NlpD